MRLADRRTATRFEIVGELWGSVQSVEPIQVCNLAREGALVQTVAPLPVGSVQSLQLVQGPDNREVRAVVRHLSPVHLRDGGRRYLVGLEFIDVDLQAAAWIGNMMDQCREPAATDEA